MDRPWTSAIHKSPVDGPLLLGPINLDGDAQGDLIHHGGPDKAVCCYPAAHYPAWRLELALPDLAPGAFGENFTLEGLVESEVCIGDVYRIGPHAMVQVSQPRQPCWKLARRWRIKDLVLRVQDSGRTGWYFRVLQPGLVAPGLALQLTERPNPDWPLTLANHLMHHDRSNREAAASLANVPQLSESWRTTLSNRARGSDASTNARTLGP